MTCYPRILDATNKQGWADGDSGEIDTQREPMAWEPDHGDLIAWAMSALSGWGTLQPSCSPPYDQRTWFAPTWMDWSRLGAAVDLSALLAGFTRAEASEIGRRTTAPPPHPARAAR